ncbi:unnamed protein product, partial [Mesorhabditis spiculigera]
MNERTGLDYIKAIIPCLDYTIDLKRSKARLVLQRALTATSEISRKWCTRFLLVLANIPEVDFSSWGVKLMLAQLGDASPKVVRHAIRIILQNAQNFGQALGLLRSPLLDTFGDAGILLKAALAGQESFCTNRQEMCTQIRFWLQSFSLRYAEMVEEEMRIALLGVRRNITGEFARPTSDRFERYGVRAQPHLFGELAGHDLGKELLQGEAVVEQLLEGLTDDTVLVVKASLLGLGHIGSRAPEILPLETVPLIVRLAEQSEVLSVRGTALYALCMIGGAKEGARSIARLGWESTRHKNVVNEVRFEEKTPAPRPTINYEPTTFRVERRPSLLYVDYSPCPSPSPSRPRSRSLASIDGTGPFFSKKRQSAPAFAIEAALEPRSLSPAGYLSPRGDRSLTIESMAGHHGSSNCEDRRHRALSRATLEEGDDLLSRTSTIITACSHLQPKSKLEQEMERLLLAAPQSDHFSCRARARWRLRAPRLRQCIQVFKTVGHPVRYNLMTREQLFELGHFEAEAFGDDCVQKELELCFEDPPPTYSPLPFISLPVEVDLIARNIFNFNLEILDDTVEDRGAKSGYGRLRLDQVKGHDRLRCFYCSIPESKKPPFQPGPDSAALRLEVLQLIDFLEVKRVVPENKLLNLRKQHSWLFTWPCLYADVLEMLDQYRFKVRSRVFLQEIFYEAMKLLR